MKFTEMMLDDRRLGATRVIETAELDRDMLLFFAGLLSRLRSGQKSVTISYPGKYDLSIRFGTPTIYFDSKHKAFETSDRFFSIYYQGIIAVRVNHLTADAYEINENRDAAAFMICNSVNPGSIVSATKLRESRQFSDTLDELVRVKPGLISEITFQPYQGAARQTVLEYSAEVAAYFAAAMFESK